jgi:hypothetical protein
MKTKIFPMVTLVALAATQVRAEEPLADIEIVKVPAAEVAAKPPSLPSGFVARLTPEERTAAGVEKLSAEQRTALDAQVAKEVRLARQGDVTGFAGTFISRRTDEERTAAGLATLTTGEKYQLDRLVSRTLASRPPQPPMAITRPASDGELLLKTKSDWETHGFVQLEYGFGSGDREYKAATMAVEQVNVKTGTAFTFAYTVAEGDGLWWNRGYGHGYGYGYGWRSRPFGGWRY